MPNGEFHFSGYLEPEEVRAIIGTIPQVSKHSERDQLLIELLWQSGARVTEAITLVPERIGMTSVVLRNLKQKAILKDKDGKTVRDENRKIVKISDPNALKEVEVSEPLCNRLRQFCKVNEISSGEWVFKSNRNSNKHLSRWYVWNMLTKVSEVAQVFKFGKRHPRTGGKFKGAYPHILRHSTAMFLLDQTENIDLVREHLGHASVVTTQGYAAVSKRKMKTVIKDIQW